MTIFVKMGKEREKKERERERERDRRCDSNSK